MDIADTAPAEEPPPETETPVEVPKTKPRSRRNKPRFTE
jgi:hypothetical protein